MEELSIISIDLWELPEGLQNLKKLKTLDLSHNKLTIDDEIQKLKRLPSLKTLIVIGNLLDTVSLNRWMQENPNLKVIYNFDQLKEQRNQ